MNSHKVLALKYRPKTFSELIGQEAVSRTLSLALDNGKLSHAYLFSGLRGSGKTSSARIFAKSLLCEKGISSEPCEVCGSCVQANEGRHIDIVEMDAASNRRIDDIRDLIETTKYSPSFGRFKIFIIDEAHMLTKEAFNALLKTLEEPPDFVKFLLATTDPLKLPPTILSRTQHFRFKKIGFNDALKHLNFIISNEGVEADAAALEIIARSGGGSLRDTLTLLEQAIIYGKGRVELNATVEMLGVLDPAQIARYFDLISGQDRKGAIAFTREIESSDPEMVIDEMIDYLKEQIYKQNAQFNIYAIERFFRILADMKDLLYKGADSGFLLGLASLKMIEALRPEAVGAMIESLESRLGETAGDIAAERQRAAPAPAQKRSASEEASTAADRTVATEQTAVTHAADRAVATEPATRETAADRTKAFALFNELKRKISDRSAALGEAFDRSVRFVSFENGELKWKSAPKEEDGARLRKDYPVVIEMVREVFGDGTKIVKDRSGAMEDIRESDIYTEAVKKFGDESVTLLS
ncbi:MAG: DNA polymerase III subunit gamma/tau [Helicobacteraceae bacterium]|jgi:DNA polymerase-3 subunit gamma/tau|nr:DNA polymerase III subunit gamma/tau [Helicobacteraceae bacterium]